jgi:hypothetical protein
MNVIGRRSLRPERHFGHAPGGRVPRVLGRAFWDSFVVVLATRVVDLVRRDRRSCLRLREALTSGMWSTLGVWTSSWLATPLS